MDGKSTKTGEWSDHGIEELCKDAQFGHDEWMLKGAFGINMALSATVENI